MPHVPLRFPGCLPDETSKAQHVHSAEWLATELRVQRGQDALSDPERQEYQQWACLELYWSRPEEQGGCGGDMKSLCSHLLSAIMDQQLSEQSLDKLHHRVSDTGTCLPDILSRLQELVYEMEVSDLCGSCSGRAELCDFLFEFVSRRCSSAVSSVSSGVSSELSLQHTLNMWNRVLLALPAVLFVKSITATASSSSSVVVLQSAPACSRGGSQGYSAASECAAAREGHSTDRVLVFLLFPICKRLSVSASCILRRETIKKPGVYAPEPVCGGGLYDWLLILINACCSSRVLTCCREPCDDPGSSTPRRLLCYISLLQLFLEDTHTYTHPGLNSLKTDLTDAPLPVLQPTQRQLESQCADLDPEVAAALSVHSGSQSLSLEMDFSE
ncbi:Fanconi anemia group A protein [Lates japonicus]|uniref:Fanconi anemia group A protein n=1 Tax=Lates japonicus TaxID=270547 RepID=A0AAD3RLH3_LATJO|nr:Fanconi anemia group A protein [Lates japonicus]